MTEREELIANIARRGKIDEVSLGEISLYLRSEPARLAAARNEAIEECARVADDHADQNEDTALGKRRNETARDIAAAIRNLKDPQ